MEVEAGNWMLTILNVVNWMIGPVTILCWLCWRRFAMNRDNLEVEPNMGVRQPNGSDARNVVHRTDPGGQVEPVQYRVNGSC
jgi:hypothetical protein